MVAMRSAGLTSLTICSFAQSSPDSILSRMSSSLTAPVAIKERFASIVRCCLLLRAMGATQTLMCNEVLKAHDA